MEDKRKHKAKGEQPQKAHPTSKFTIVMYCDHSLLYVASRLAIVISK